MQWGRLKVKNAGKKMHSLWVRYNGKTVQGYISWWFVPYWGIAGASSKRVEAHFVSESCVKIQNHKPLHETHPKNFQRKATNWSSNRLDALPRFLECFGRNWHLFGRHQMVQSFWLRYVDCGHLGTWRMGRHAKYLDKQQSYEATTTLGLDDKVISSFQVEISLSEFWYHLGVYLIICKYIYILYLSIYSNLR